jgi:integrase/recombinase XerD
MSGRRQPTSGPLGEYVEGFLVELVDLGYAQRSREAQLRLLRLLSGFLQSRGLAGRDLTSGVLADFVAARRRTGTKMRSPRALMPLLRYLHRLGAVSLENTWTASTPGALEPFTRYLTTERRLASTTVAGYLSQLRPFVAEFPDPERWRSLTAGEVSAFVLQRKGRASARSVQARAKALRALLRWLWLEGTIATPLADTIRPFASGRGTRPPRSLTIDEVTRLNAAVASGPDRLRNEAMVALMLRLGLRAGEVAALRLDDIDWRSSVLLVWGKGAHVDPLPLPVDVGQALVAYLTEGRPTNSTDRQVFLRSPAPHTSLSVAAVSNMVAAALRRAGVSGPGAAHRLRHTAACGVLAAGGGLVEAGQLLRHSTRSATAIYAKADLPALRVLARPWPSRSEAR